MLTYFVTETNWLNFISSLVSQYRVFGLIDYEGELKWRRLNEANSHSITITKYRSIQPIKKFFFPVKEEVTAEPSAQKTILIGCKNCDLNHLKTTDSMFVGSPVSDPYYLKRRENTIIISSDCDDFRKTCFCTSMDEDPFPSKGFDINLSPTRGGFIVEIATKTAEQLISVRKHYFQDPQPILLQEREKMRKRITELVKNNNSELNWTDPQRIVSSTYNSKAWDDDIASTCVECDACRFVCGTCYCFILSETKDIWSRIRTWDSCQSAGYARVAGGGNPKNTRAKRLKNFYACKLVYRKENFGFYACTGCGRCIEVCQGKIDIRQSLAKLKKLEKNV
ncbi:MAG: 4Fe-4S dicluster domain-containing protein [Endomicrobiales bacterium]|nr:4Fe-4S dicluster domain-containing protein [Endomicrobiales bacterium]